MARKKYKYYEASFTIPDANTTVETISFKAGNFKEALLKSLLELEKFVVGTKLDFIMEDEEDEYFIDGPEHLAKLFEENFVLPYRTEQKLTKEQENELYYSGKYLGCHYDSEEWKF